jgi:predicted O-methyltransferase YrrM
VHQEDTISTDKSASWAHSEDFRTVDEVVLRATDRAEQLGCGSVSPGTGAVLQLLASALKATAVVEIGTGAGVAGLWLLAGMAPDGVLTTIDSEAEHQRAAKDAFAEAGVRPTRARTITGRPLEVLPRLTDGAYDLVLANGDPLELADHVEQALRLLRPGGVLAVAHALGGDKVPDPARRDEVTTALREVSRRLRDDDRVVPALLPTGDGLLLASRR